MSSPAVEKSYLPQYIQYAVSGKPEYVQLDSESLPKADVITFPAIEKPLILPEEGLPYQNKNQNHNSIYPKLHANENLRNGEISAKTPLLVKKKIVPTKTNYFGILLAFISGMFFTFCSGTVKYLTDVDPMELLVFRSLFQVGVTLPIVLAKGYNVMGPQGSRILLFFQGIIGGMTLVMLFYSFRLLPLGDAATIIFSSPVFVMVMSHIFLREPCGFYRTLIVFLLVTGVVFITKPPFLFARDSAHESYNVVGYICALFGTVFTALNIVIMRKCKDCHFSVVVFQFSFWSLVISSAILFVGGHAEMPKNSLDQWGLILLVAIFGISGQILVAIALTYEGAGRVAVTRSMDIVLAYVLQVLIFSEVPDWKSVMGATMVMICVIGMGIEDIVHRWMNNLP